MAAVAMTLQRDASKLYVPRRTGFLFGLHTACILWMCLISALTLIWTGRAATTVPHPATPSSTAPFGHVFILVEENANYSDVIGSSKMPYLNSLANQYGLATQYYADTHPSIGNYMMLTTGRVLTDDDSQTPLTFPVSVDNAVRELIASGKSWRQYAESIPSVGYIGGDSTCCGGRFITRHAPLPYMKDAQAASQLSNTVPFEQLAKDLANNTLPNYGFITPNGCNDAHDCHLDVGDNWLKTNIDPLIKSLQFKRDGLLVIVFDESATDKINGGGRVPALIISPFAKGGYKSTKVYRHESVLRLLLEGLGVTKIPGSAAAAPKMWEFFNFTPPS
jgi:phosphatidylinositol-3-phosphatase